MKDIIKKYWFIGLVCIALIGTTIYTAIENEKNVIKGKIVDNQNVIFSIGGVDVTADTYYTQLYDRIGTDVITKRFIQAVYDNVVETTPELEKEAKTQAEYTIQQLKAQYGAQYDETMEQFLNSVGYQEEEDFYLYNLTNIKQDKVLSDVVSVLYDEYQKEAQPKMVSHILVAMADPKNPTKEELDKLALVKTELDSGKSFKEVALAHTDDTGSKEAGGSLGFTDKTLAENFVVEFKEAIFTLKEGETSEWVYTTYGAHLIHIDTEKYEDFLSLAKDTFYNQIFEKNADYLTNYIKEEANKIGYTFTDSTIQDAVEIALEFKEGTK